MQKQVAILGSTGSIGTQTLDVVRSYPQLYKVYSLSAQRNVQKLSEQAREFLPEVVCIADPTYYDELCEALHDLPIKVVCGEVGLCEGVTADKVDVVVSSIVGFAGLIPTIEAIKKGKNIALANKETLVVAGELITNLCKQYQSQLVPIDSEHSAIFQCVQGENNEIKKIILTASGGPFRGFSKAELAKVSSQQALQHPNWKMGDKITIDSATLMNKGFELIEAKWLFAVEVSKIEILIHPQSIVHSAVEFADGAIKAQLGVPDMHLPIQYALTYPDRLPCKQEELDLAHMATLSFARPDMEAFPCLQLAFEAIKKGGNMPCILNAANEVVNRAFIENRCTFYQMSDAIQQTMQQATWIEKPTLEDYLHSDKEARNITENLIKSTK